MDKTKMNNQPIGIFDSGIGGLSVVREIIRLLPKESIIYLADKTNFPYGSKTEDEIKHIAKKNVDWLLSRGAKMIVVACNTATVNAISYLRKKFPTISFVGIEPAVKPASLLAKKGIIILSSPKATKSKQLISLIKKYAKNIKVFNLGSLDLVKAVEENAENHKIKKILKKALTNKILSQTDVIVLGCTHFPLIKEQIQNYVGKGIILVDSGKAVAQRVKEILNKKNLRSFKNRKLELFISGINEPQLNNETMYRYLRI